MESHRKIAGHIKPERHILLLPGHVVGLGQLIQIRPGFDKPKKIGLEHLAGQMKKGLPKPTESLSL
jgi:hypothetical protein